MEVLLSELRDTEAAAAVLVLDAGRTVLAPASARGGVGVWGLGVPRLTQPLHVKPEYIVAQSCSPHQSPSLEAGRSVYAQHFLQVTCW